MKQNRLSAFIVCLILGFFLSMNWQLSAQENTNLTVSAAISLKSSLEEIAKIYQAEKNKDITYNFGSSGSLQQQIEQGAPVDVFISAALKQMDALESKNLLLKDSRRNLLKNQLVLITPSANTKITSFEDLKTANVQRIAIGEPQSVPAGQYAQESLKHYNVLSEVENKLVYTKNVAQVLNYVASGNVDAGIVYITDAKTTDKVRVAAIASSESHSEIIYPIAIIKDTKQLETAQQYLEFLSSDKSKEIFEKFGFTLAEK